MFRCLLILFLIPANTLVATAQEIETLAPTSTAALSSDFGLQLRSVAKRPIDHQTLIIVTLAEPDTRHKCHVLDTTEDSIVCGSNIHHKQITYQRNDIAAVIDPATHVVRNYMVTLIAISAVCLASSFFVPLLPSVILRVVTALVLFSGPVGLIGANDHKDILLYQRPNTPLTVTLR